MICTGKEIDNSITNETRFVNEDGEEIFYGYRNASAPLKVMITGCNGKNNYIGDTSLYDSKTEFTLLNGDEKVLTIYKLSGVMPKCEIIGYPRDLKVKFSIGLGFTRSTVIEENTELASMTRKRKEYVLEIKEGENPTLLASVLMGAAEVNGFTNNIEK